MTYYPFSNTPNPNELLVEYGDFPKEFSEEFRVKIIQMINDMCISINSKESSYYSNEISVTAAKVLPTYRTTLQGDESVYYRTVRRKCVFTTSLPNSSIKTVKHNIIFPKYSVGWRLWGCASQVARDETLNGFLELPYAHPTPANCISLYCDRDNINITTGTNRSGFNFSFVIVEFAVPPETDQEIN